MEDVFDLLKRIIPEELDALVRRYEVLKTIYTLKTAGRRSVAAYLDFTERIVRSETDKLFAANLVKVEKAGISVTLQGQEVLEKLDGLIHELTGLTMLEREMKDILNVKEVCIVKGNSDENENIKKDIGLQASRVFLKSCTADSVIALTGGSTMECLVEAVPENTNKQAKTVVPARGSVGHKIEQQADTLAALLAGKLHAQYCLLNIPDSMGLKAMNEIRNEPAIQNTISQMQKASILLFGIGNALEMAEKRRVTDTIYDFLKRKGAVAEAFGYYFNEAGEIIYSSRSLSIKLEEIKRIPSIIAVAGGRKKAQAILSLSRILKHAAMVIDEGAANEIKRLVEKE